MKAGGGGGGGGIFPVESRKGQNPTAGERP